MPRSWWVKSKGEDVTFFAGVDLNEDAVQANVILAQLLKDSMNWGLLCLRNGRLRLTGTGMDALALPSALFVSNIPAETRIDLARADLKFHGQDYEGCAIICGNSMEAFLRVVVQSLHPGAGLQGFVKKSGSKKWDQLGLGDLLWVASAHLGINEHLTAKEVDRRSANLLSTGFDVTEVWDPTTEERRKTFCRLVDMVNQGRKKWAHEKRAFATHHEEVESIYRLLNLTRIAISSYCSMRGNQLAPHYLE